MYFPESSTIEIGLRIKISTINKITVFDKNTGDYICDSIADLLKWKETFYNVFVHFWDRNDVPKSPRYFNSVDSWEKKLDKRRPT